MALRKTSRVLAVLVAACVLFSTAAAFAMSSPNGSPLPGGGPNMQQPLPTPGPVPVGVSVAGHNIGGLSDDQARSVILAYVKPSGFHDLTVKAAGFTFTLAARDVFYTDVEGMLAEAYAASGRPTAVAPRFEYNTLACGTLVTSIGTKLDSKAINARWYLSAKRLKLQPSVPARHVDRTTGLSLILTAMDKELANGGAAQPAVTIPVATSPARFTEKSLGRAILVVLSERYLRLYDPAKGGYVMHGYPCAVGQPAYPTPTGLWHIVLKRYMPTWVNPGDAWGAGMPAVIGPGYNNPLGTRAMNLDANGIRIHGTANIASLGTPASHGCIRLAMPNVEQLFDLVVVGTPVYIIK